ncbi:MAG: hypothetical protein ACK5XN_22625 [Bacteroidota bacterium]
MFICSIKCSLGSINSYGDLEDYNYYYSFYYKIGFDDGKSGLVEVYQKPNRANSNPLDPLNIIRDNASLEGYFQGLQDGLREKNINEIDLTNQKIDCIFNFLTSKYSLYENLDGNKQPTINSYLDIILESVKFLLLNSQNSNIDFEIFLSKQKEINNKSYLFSIFIYGILNLVFLILNVILLFFIFYILRNNYKLDLFADNIKILKESKRDKN